MTSAELCGPDPVLVFNNPLLSQSDSDEDEPSRKKMQTQVRRLTVSRHVPIH